MALEPLQKTPDMTAPAREHHVAAPSTTHAAPAVDAGRLFAGSTATEGIGSSQLSVPGKRSGTAVDTAAPGSVTEKAPTPEESSLIKDYVDVVTESFMWFSNEAEAKVGALREDLKRVDPPSWSEQLATFVLESALAAGAQAGGLALAAKIVTSDVAREFLQNIFASGVTGGVDAGRAKLTRGSDDNVIGPFIESQSEGVRARQQLSQTEFLMNGRHQIKTVSQAYELSAACARPNAVAAAGHQYNASRDAWVSYVAQQRFGSVSSKVGPLATVGTRAPWIDVGEVTTNMTNQSTRDRDRSHPSGALTTPRQAPDWGDAAIGDSPGVLTLVVDLPAITRTYGTTYGGLPRPTAEFEMQGVPSVALAILNGVNDTVRKQYVGQSLAASRIPRQIVARVSGGANFTLNLDEKGHVAQRPADIKWLASRAVIEKPERWTFDDEDNHVRGIQLLLKDLVPVEIVDKVLP